MKFERIENQLRKNLRFVLYEFVELSVCALKKKNKFTMIAVKFLQLSVAAEYKLVLSCNQMLYKTNHTQTHEHTLTHTVRGNYKLHLMRL